MAVPGFALAETAGSPIAGEQAASARKLDKQVVAAERAAIKQPQSAQARARLGQVYLAAGRFTSAATSFEDAVSLGDKTPESALGMALSYIGANRNAEAVALLGQWRDSIPAGDYALALALAGDASQAVSILSSAIKQGDNTPKNRQNLAYAYAMGGHLAEARVIAGQDVPVDQLDGRISDWALQASVGSQQSRVAALLGAPVRSDPGQPAQLALATTPGQAQLATSTVSAPPPSDRELPALEGGAAPMVAQAPAAADMPAAVQSPQELAAAAPTADAAPALADGASSASRFVSNPVVQAIPASTAQTAPRAQVRALAEAPRAAPKPRSAAPRQAAAAPANPTHLVQLGSFSTEEGAHRAWGIFVRRDPSLKDHELRITQAVVNGRNYWRVAAAGYDMASARSKCTSVRGSGSECLAYTSGRQVPRAVAAVAQRLAQR